MKPRLLIVDDDENIQVQMKWALEPDYEVLQAHERNEAIATFKTARPPMVLLDLGLPPQPADSAEGLQTLSELQSIDPLVKVVVVTGQGERDNALRAIPQGAYDFLCKPIQIDELRIILKRCLYLAQIERELRDLERHRNDEMFEGMLGSSPQMQEVFASIRKVAGTNAPVLLLGESGTGKEMAALAIHRRSARRDGPFIAINCGAIPENLLESELFGHEKGSFTGAHVQRQGRIESAASGTLFLDEIGELPQQLQVKLLRFLQEQQIERVGGRKPIDVDTRVVAATNTDLVTAMRDGKFREDLYYRLAVVVVHLPPLRQRQNDVALLAESFLQKFALENGKKRARFDKDARVALRQHHWPGNVRELVNRVRRAVIMSDSGAVKAADLELVAPPEAAQPSSLKDARERVERSMILETLRKNNGNVSRAAAELEVSRPTLYELMSKLGIKNE